MKSDESNRSTDNGFNDDNINVNSTDNRYNINANSNR